jgi:hypothetical protein
MVYNDQTFVYDIIYSQNIQSFGSFDISGTDQSGIFEDTWSRNNSEGIVYLYGIKETLDISDIVVQPRDEIDTAQVIPVANDGNHVANILLQLENYTCCYRLYYEQITEFSENMNYYDSISGEKRVAYYRFTPQTDGIYSLESLDATASAGCVLFDMRDNGMYYLAADVGNWEDKDFHLEYRLTAGTTYYYRVYTLEDNSFDVKFTFIGSEEEQDDAAEIVTADEELSIDLFAEENETEVVSETETETQTEASEQSEAPVEGDGADEIILDAGILDEAS